MNAGFSADKSNIYTSKLKEREAKINIVFEKKNTNAYMTDGYISISLYKEEKLIEYEQN